MRSQITTLGLVLLMALSTAAAMDGAEREKHAWDIRSWKARADGLRDSGSARNYVKAAELEAKAQLFENRLEREGAKARKAKKKASKAAISKAGVNELKSRDDTHELAATDNNIDDAAKRKNDREREKTEYNLQFWRERVSELGKAQTPNKAAIAEYRAKIRKAQDRVDRRRDKAVKAADSTKGLKGRDDTHELVTRDGTDQEPVPASGENKTPSEPSDNGRKVKRFDDGSKPKVKVAKPASNKQRSKLKTSADDVTDYREKARVARANKDPYKAGIYERKADALEKASKAVAANKKAVQKSRRRDVDEAGEFFARDSADKERMPSVVSKKNKPTEARSDSGRKTKRDTGDSEPKPSKQRRPKTGIERMADLSGKARRARANGEPAAARTYEHRYKVQHPVLKTESESRAWYGQQPRRRDVDGARELLPRDMADELLAQESSRRRP